MKSLQKTSVILALTALFVSCDVNYPIYDLPPQPTQGTLTLTTDWTKRTEGVEVPASYTVQVGAFSTTFSGLKNDYPDQILPGNYRLYVYNTADKITVSGTIATVATLSGSRSILLGSESVEPMPGWFFSGKADVAIAVGNTHDIAVAMKQEVCQLSIELTVTEGDSARITGITGTLSGVAGAWDFSTDTSVGDPLNVSPAFTKAGNKITAQTRLLGVVPSAVQVLTLTVSFSDGSEQVITRELTADLTTFNTDQHISVSVTANVQLPVEGVFSCTITDWVVGNDRPIIAD